ncbi:MAG TPA: LCP family protein [Patescibacteria group bacterium]|nr:LCP family protein [Patescibacteria group bacterium]
MPFPQRRIRRKVRWDRIILLVAVLLLIVALLVGGVVLAYWRITSPPAGRGGSAPAPVQETLNGRMNILLLGVDDAVTENGAENARRSDTMIVAAVDPEAGSLSLLSIPRDTRVNIPGRQGQEKICHAYAYGGPELARRTVEQNLQIPVMYYVLVDWQAFVKMIDVLGGVDLYVENKMHYEDPYANLTIQLNQGYQHLDGQKAGEYVRFRSDELGDIARVQRQQRFLKALAKEIFRLDTILKVPALSNTINQYVQTDMTLYTMMKLVNSLKAFKPETMMAEMLPGRFATIGGLSYWVMDNEKSKLLVDRIFFNAGNKPADANGGNH